MKDYSTEVKLANTLRLPHLAFKVIAIIFSIFTLVTMLFSIKMLMDVKTYMALFFLCLYLPLCMLSIAFTLFTYQQATSNPSHYNKTKQALLTKLLYLAVTGVLALLTLTVWYSSQMEKMVHTVPAVENNSQQGRVHLVNQRTSLVGLGVSAGLTSLFGFVVLGGYISYIRTLQKHHESLVQSKSRLHEMELYADAVQHLYEEMKLEKQAPDTPRRVV